MGKSISIFSHGNAMLEDVRVFWRPELGAWEVTLQFGQNEEKWIFPMHASEDEIRRELHRFALCLED
jgi:hypothetical protein